MCYELCFLNKADFQYKKPTEYLEVDSDTHMI